MNRIFFLSYFSFLTLFLNAQDALFVLLETDTVFTTTCDSVDYCVFTGNANAYPNSEVTVNGIFTEGTGFCNFDTITIYPLVAVVQNGPWTIETEMGGQSLNFIVNSFSEIADTFNLYYPDCNWEFGENIPELSCHGSHPSLGVVTISNSEGYSMIYPSIYVNPLGFTLRLDYGENEIIVTHEDGYADTSIVSVIHEEQMLEAVELNLAIGESESYLAESQCGSEMFTYINLCEANSTGAAELLTDGNTYEIKAVAAGIDTICVRYTDEFGFSKRQDFYLSVLTSVEEMEEERCDIYPNPTFDFINITGFQTASLIEIQDINGQVTRMIEGDNMEGKIDLRGLLNGVYIISIIDEKGRRKSNLFVKM